jgi:hypothetical protein
MGGRSLFTIIKGNLTIKKMGCINTVQENTLCQIWYKTVQQFPVVSQTEIKHRYAYVTQQ